MEKEKKKYTADDIKFEVKSPEDMEKLLRWVNTTPTKNKRAIQDFLNYGPEEAKKRSLERIRAQY